MENTPSWLEHFHQKGWAVVPSVISPEKASYYRQKQLSWVEKHSWGKFKYAERKTWKSDNLPPERFKEGIYSDNSLAHEKWMWEARLEPSLVSAFEQIWKTKSLLVSFDCMNVTLPELPQSKKQSNTVIPPWPHTDQFATDMDLLCVQGILNTGPCGPKDGGLIVLSGSAPLWQSFWSSETGQAKMKRERLDAIGPEDKRDLTNFKPPEVEWFTKRPNGCEIVKVEMKPGDLVIWDSRTIHYNCAPKGDDLRSAIYICYGPREMATTKDLETKMALFYAKQASNHWPNVNVTGVGGDERAKGLPQEEHEWTDEMLKAAGVEPYD